jgi:hypothetical protein
MVYYLILKMFVAIIKILFAIGFVQAGCDCEEDGVQYCRYSQTSASDFEATGSCGLCSDTSAPKDCYQNA